MAASKSKQYHWVMLSFSFTIAFLLHLLLFVTAPMATVIMEEMGLSYADFGFVFSAAMISLILFRIPWGVSRRQNRLSKGSQDSITYLDSLCWVKGILAWLPDPLIKPILSWAGPGRSDALPPSFSEGMVFRQDLRAFHRHVRLGFAVGNATALGLTPHLLQLMGWRDVLLAYSGMAVVVCGLLEEAR